MTVVLIYEDVFGDDFGEEGFYISLIFWKLVLQTIPPEITIANKKL